MNRGLLLVIGILSAMIAHGQSFEFLRSAPSSASASMQKPVSMAINSQGHVFISDALSKVIYEFDESGSQVGAISSVTTVGGEIILKDPTQLFVDGHDNLYIYDKFLAKVIVRYATGSGISFGEKGSQFGQIDNVRGLVADDQGYVYVLNGSRKQVDIFQPDGTYLTWISGGFNPFKNPLSIGINGKDEIYILEEDGPSILMFDVYGNQINVHRDVSGWDGVSIKKAVSMAVLRNGDFFILDGETARITQFNKIGIVLGTLGSKGVSSAGTFIDATLLAAGTSMSKALLVLDATAHIAQVFSVSTINKPMVPEIKRIKFLPQASRRQPVRDLALSSTGIRYVIPTNNDKIVLAYDDTTNIEKFAFNDKFKEAIALQTDKKDNLYVVDRSGKEVYMFDDKGVLIRKFGKDIPEKLKEPTSIAIQSTGNVVVCDHGNGFIQMWNGQGVYQKIITSAENSALESPYKIQLDSKDQIYIWDDKENCIFRAGASGWPIAGKKLRARSEKPGESAGAISGFFVDPLDQIYVFNSTTHQIEVYVWDVEPQLKFSMGYPGKGANAFGDIENILLDKETFLVYFMEKGGKAQKVIQFLVKPPVPDPSVTFDAANGQLLMVFNKLNSRAVTGYGFVTSGSDGQDSIAARTSSAMLSLDENMRSDLDLHHYEFVSLSKSDYSDASFGFDNYLGYGDRLLAAERYDEALAAYQEAIDRFGASRGMSAYLSAKTSVTSRTLAINSEVGRAVPYMRFAFSLAPEDAEVRRNASNVLYAYFSELSNRDDVARIVEEADQMRSASGLQSIVLDAIDSLNAKLGKVQNERSLGQSIFLGKTIIGWDPSNARYANTLASNSYELFKLKSLIGVPALELEAIINEAGKYASQSVIALKRLKKPYYNEHILELQILNASGRHSEAEQQAIKELTESVSALSPTQVIAYRMELAKASIGQSNFDQAVLEYERIQTLDPDNKKVKNLLAEALMDDAKYDEAKVIYQQLLVSDANNARYAAQIGRIELFKGNYPEASFQLEKAVKQDPSERSFYGPLAEAFEGASNYKKALENYKIAVQYQDFKIDQAANRITSMQEMNSLKGQLNDYLLKVAKLNDQIGDYDAAIAAYKKAIDTDPSNAQAYFGLGKSSLNAGLVYDAVNSFSSACKLEPDNQVYQSDYANAMSLRTKVSKNESALSILDLHIKEIYPSLYHNYSDVSLLPVGEVIIANNSDLPITPTSVSVFVKELMDQPTRVKTPAMVGYSNTYLELSALFGDQILKYTEDQKLQMEVVIEYTLSGESQSVKKSAPFVLHGRNAITWSDKRRLAAFVAPSLEVLIDYDKKSDILFKDAPAFGLNKPILKAMQTYTVLHNSNYVYSPDPVQSYAFVSTHTELLDFLQYPAETMKRKSGDCDDLVTLYAALLENAGIATAYIDIPGHVLMAFDAQIGAGQLSSSGLEVSDVIVFQDKVWIPIETTLVGKHGFMTAWKSGAERYYKELNEGNFPEVVPMADARKIYIPSVYVPENFSEEPKGGKPVMNEYNTQVTELLAKVNKAVIRNLESRYQTEPGNLFVKNRYASLLAKIGEEDKAERILLEALDMSPNNPAILNNLGNVYLLKGDAQNAIEYYSQAAEVDKTDGEIHINLCKAYLLAGDKPQAGTCFNKAISLNTELGFLYDELKTQLK